MIINGTGLTKNINYQIHKGFSVENKYALNFFELYNGGYGVIDRTSDEDDYQCIINVMGTKDHIITLQNALETNRHTGEDYSKNVLVLSGFNESEKIFGADVDYSGNLVTTAIIERRIHRTLSTFSIELRLVAQDLSFVMPNDLSFPRLSFVNTGYDGDTDKSINKMFSLNNYFYIRDHDFDKGTFSGVCQLSNKEMIRLKYNHRVDRGIPISMPYLSGVDNPFGLRDSSNCNVRLIEIVDEIVVGYNCGEPIWICNLTFSEEF